jgi:hypothetical protein
MRAQSKEAWRVEGREGSNSNRDAGSSAEECDQEKRTKQLGDISITAEFKGALVQAQ